MNKILSKHWPSLVIIAVWFIFSSPFFIQGKIPYPSVYQNSFFSPWSDYKKYALPVKNNALSDVVNQIYPWKHFTIQELKKGNIPWWNPYSFSGSPHLANSQTAVFSPLNFLFFIFPFIDAWSLAILFQPLLAGLFMYLYLKKLKISNDGTLLGSIAFMFCGFMTAWMPYGTLSLAISFLPLALYSIESLAIRPTPLHFIFLSLSITLSFFSGHLQTSVYLSLFVLIYIFFKLTISFKFKKTFFLLSSFILGILFSLFQILPSFNLYLKSVRSELFSTDGSVPLNYLITLIAPNFFGNPVTRNDWMGNYAEWASFIGIIPFVFSTFSVLAKKEKSNITFFLIAGFFALIFSLSSPLQKIILNLKIPVFSTSIPSRIIVLFSFSLAVLSAYGFDSARHLIQKREIKKIFSIGLVLSLFFLTIWGILLIIKPFEYDKVQVALKNFLPPTALFFTCVLLLGSLLKINKRKYTSIILKLIIIISALDSLYFVNKWIPFDPKESVFPDLPVISAMKKNLYKESRIYGKFGSYIDTYYRLPSIEGYDPLYIKRYGEFIESAKTGTYNPAVKSVAFLDKNSRNAARVLNLLGVGMLFHVIGDTGKDWAYPVWQKDEKGKYLYSVIYQDNEFQLYKNPAALPRAKLFYDFEIIKNDEEIISTFFSDKFDYRNKLILEVDPLLPKITKEINIGSAKIVSYSPNKVKINTYSLSPGILFLSDNYYPGWKVKVNGKNERILRADYTFRAVKVPKGNSSVEFYYDPWPFI
jgi:hypothetical protein